jgi:peptidyl-prolyl cis-trans isomerase SurA
MSMTAKISKVLPCGFARVAGALPICLAMMLCWPPCADAQQGGAAAGSVAVDAPVLDAGKTVQLDSVVAVVNSAVILSSDLEFEMRVFRLLPIGDRGDFTPEKALQRLTTRALIEQQILLEDPHGLDVSPKDLEDSLAELRQNIPDCRHRDCASAEGWRAYLATLGLTPERVADYWAHRMAVLRFIEVRFRSGNRVTPEEIQKYYQESLVPKYAKPEDAPPLDKVSQRIQEILLQQKVNALLNDWLKSLQDQGQVEILDPALKAASAGDNADPKPAASDKSGPDTPGSGLAGLATTGPGISGSGEGGRP